MPQELETVLATALQRNPQTRQASAREFAEALQSVQRSLGLVQTPLEIAPDSWAAGGRAVDFADSGLRGPVRASVPYTSARKAPATDGPSARSAHSDSSGLVEPGTKVRSSWPWILTGLAATALLVILAVLLHLWRVV